MDEKDSGFEISDGRGFRALKTKVRPSECWFNVLYHRPLDLIDLLDEGLLSLEAFAFVPNLEYVRHTVRAVREIRDELLVQLQLIVFYVTQPPLRGLFRRHTCEHIWVLAHGHLGYRCRELVLHGSQLHMSREELETWVLGALQPLAFRDVPTILLSWDPGYAPLAFRKESGLVGVDEVVVEDPDLQTLSTFRSVRGGAWDGVGHAKRVMELYWGKKSALINSKFARDPNAQDGVEGLLVGEIEANISECRLSHPEYIALIHSLARPNRSGKLFPMETSAPWMPGDDLETIRKKSLEYFELCTLMKAQATLEKSAVPAGSIQ